MCEKYWSRYNPPMCARKSLSFACMHGTKRAGGRGMVATRQFYVSVNRYERPMVEGRTKGPCLHCPQD
jgi:hypothetical protein